MNVMTCNEYICINNEKKPLLNCQSVHFDFAIQEGVDDFRTEMN